jgi:hypothetical protein
MKSSSLLEWKRSWFNTWPLNNHELGSLDEDYSEAFGAESQVLGSPLWGKYKLKCTPLPIGEIEMHFQRRWKLVSFNTLPEQIIAF